MTVTHARIILSQEVEDEPNSFVDRQGATPVLSHRALEETASTRTQKSARRHLSNKKTLRDFRDPRFGMAIRMFESRSSV